MSVRAGSAVVCTQPRRRIFAYDAVLDELATQQQMFHGALLPACLPTSFLLCCLTAAAAAVWSCPILMSGQHKWWR